MNGPRRQSGRGTLRESPARAPVLDSSTEWICDARGCDPLLLADLDHMKETCDELVRCLKLHVLGEHWHKFPPPRAVRRPLARAAARRAADETAGRRSGSQVLAGEVGGVTGLYLLAESHLACHTFPERALAAFNLYCCRTRPAWDWSGFLKLRLSAREVLVRAIARGADAREEAS
jgi:S-adenosylmethionine decarboxylase